MKMQARLDHTGSTVVHRYRVPKKIPMIFMPSGVTSGSEMGRSGNRNMIAIPMIACMAFGVTNAFFSVICKTSIVCRFTKFLKLIIF